MLYARQLEITKSSHEKPDGLLRIVKGASEVKRTVPALQPVARIVGGEGGLYRNRPCAFVFPLPDGTLIRLRIKDNNDYDYETATEIPHTHPAAEAYAQNLKGSIKITLGEEGDLGPRANPADVKRLQERLEADMRRYQQEQAQEHHLKL